MLLESSIIVVSVLANGVFALAEIAVVSSRRTHLRKLAEGGNPRAKVALALAEAPARFLSTIQLGITLVGVFAGAYGAATIAPELAPHLESVLGACAGSAAFGLVVLAITVLSIVFGELVPKRIALHDPERAALAVAKPMALLARAGSPVVGALAGATEGVMRLFGAGRSTQATVSNEEVSMLIEQGLHEGVFHEAEKQMVEGVLALDQLAVTAIMTPLPKMVWLDLDDPDEVNWRRIVTSGHSHFPVYQGGHDNVVGMLAVKALWANSAAGFDTPMRDLLARPLFVPETITGIQLLETFKKSGRHIALVTDEFGTVCGIVTLIDVLEAIVGDLPARGQQPGPESRQRGDGSWLVDATMPLVDLKKTVETPGLPGEDRADFQTLGGFVITHFGRIPKAGDWFEAGGFRWEVVDMDRFRVDKVLISRLPPAAEDEAPGE